MPAFQVTYTTRSGRRRAFTLEADSPGGARRDLRRRGILPDSLVRKEGAKSGAPRGPQRDWRAMFEASVNVRDKAIFASKLSALVDAGVPILRSLDLMRGQQRKVRFRRALTGLIEDVTQGVNLADGMRRWPQVFDTLTVAMVEAGETGGVLDDTLKRLALLLEENARLRNQIRGAMGYPVAVLVLAILIFLGMMIFLIPTFASIFSDLGAELPGFTRLMIGVSDLIRSPFSLILLGGLLVAVYLFARYYATPVGRRQVDGLLLRTPLFGDLIVKASTAQFSRILASLSRAGVPILQSLQILRETIGNRVIGDAITASRNEVAEGVTLSTSLAAKNVIPEMAISMLAVGEETGSVDTMLSKVADFYEDEVATTIKTLTSLLEPALIVVVGVIVGSILLAMYLPMFTIFENIK
jgi:type IV pilus assembly protein PilC